MTHYHDTPAVSPAASGAPVPNIPLAPDAPLPGDPAAQTLQQLRAVEMFRYVLETDRELYCANERNYDYGPDGRDGPAGPEELYDDALCDQEGVREFLSGAFTAIDDAEIGQVAPVAAEMISAAHHDRPAFVALVTLFAAPASRYDYTARMLGRHIANLCRTTPPVSLRKAAGMYLRITELTGDGAGWLLDAALGGTEAD